MRAQSHRNLVTHMLLISLLVAAPGSAVLAGPAPGDSQPASSSPVSQQAGQRPAVDPGGGSGMMIYIDPQSGAILKEPAPGAVPLQLSPEEQNALSTSHQGLGEVPSSAPGGGVKLDLQGRFRSPLIGTTDADGKLRLQHLPETSGPDHTK